jgi:hypothetical protein
MYQLRQYFNNTSQIKQQHLLNNSIKQKINDGDIILRYGYGFVSDRIVSHLNEKYQISHCGIIKKNENVLQVIHSDSSQDKTKDGTKIIDFNTFSNESHPNSIIIVRLKNMDSTAIHQMVNVAEKYAQKHIPFDYTFDTTDDKNLFCTELVHQSIWQATGKNIFLDSLQKTNLLQFKNLYNPSNFIIIYNEQE